MKALRATTRRPLGPLVQVKPDKAKSAPQLADDSAEVSALPPSLHPLTILVYTVIQKPLKTSYPYYLNTFLFIGVARESFSKGCASNSRKSPWVDKGREGALIAAVAQPGRALG